MGKLKNSRRFVTCLVMSVTRKAKILEGKIENGGYFAESLIVSLTTESSDSRGGDWKNECIFLFLSHIFQILDIVLCPSNTIAFQEKKTPFPWIYFPGPRALFHHCFNPSLFKSLLIRQSIFPMLFDNHVSLLLAYPLNYSSCCENCTCIY